MRLLPNFYNTLTDDQKTQLGNVVNEQGDAVKADQGTYSNLIDYSYFFV